MFITLYEDNVEEKHIGMIVDTLQKDGICILPTDTLYAFVCDIRSHKAARKLADLKGKKLEKSSFSLLCNSLSMASEYIKPLSNKEFAFIKSLDSGKFTLVLPSSNLTPKIFLNKKRSIGIRISQNNIVNAVIDRLQRPLLVTSVPHEDENEDFFYNAELLYERYGKSVDAVVQSYEIKNIPSTVVDMMQKDCFEIIRQGMGIVEQW